METKLLTILKQNQGHYISGQEISKQLQVSRMTISTYIKKLKQKGYRIISSTKKGYCLTSDNDIILLKDIQSQIPDFYHRIDYYESIDSTNEQMKRGDYQQGDIIIAESQTAGKGRNGKNFLSPSHQGIYLSLLLKPHLTIYDSLKITACLAVALVKTIQNNYPLSPTIKWVNDIMVNDKKVAGILCEATLEMNTAQIHEMIVGVGLNVHSYEMPDSLKDTACCLEDDLPLFIPRQKLIIDFLRFFYEDYSHLSDLLFLKLYRQHSYILSQDITVYENNHSYDAFVLDINDDASLKIQTSQGIQNLHSGEVSIRKKT